MSNGTPPSGGSPRLPEEDAVRVAEYALGLLPEDDRAALARRIAQEPRLRQELALWEEIFAPFADEVAAVAPPAALKRRLEGTLFGGDTPHRADRWRRLLPWSLTALTGAAALVVLAVALPVLRGPEATGPMLISEITTEDEALRVLAAYDPARGGFRIERTAGIAAEGRSLELWAIGSEGVPVSLGLLTEDNFAFVPGALRGEIPGLTLAISDEPEGGSPTGAPTGAILATGTVTSL